MTSKGADRGMDQKILDEIKGLRDDMNKHLNAIEGNQKKHVGELLKAISELNSEMGRRFDDSEGGLLPRLSTKG